MVKIKKAVRDKMKELFETPIKVSLSSKQFKSHIIYYDCKKEIRFNEVYLREHRSELDNIVQQARKLIECCTEDIVYYRFS